MYSEAFLSVICALRFACFYCFKLFILFVNILGRKSVCFPFYHANLLKCYYGHPFLVLSKADFAVIVIYLLQYIVSSKRLIPEAVNFLCGILFLGSNKEGHTRKYPGTQQSTSQELSSPCHLKTRLNE